MAAEDEAHLRVTADEESLSAALTRSDEHLAKTDESFAKLGRAAQKAGTEVQSGMSRSERATNRARDAAGRFIPVAKAAGDAALGAGAKAGVGSEGFEKWAKSLDKASKKVGGFNGLIKLVKWGTLITGGQMAISMLNSLGAGAVMAIGRLSPMVGVLGAIIPLLFAFGGAMAILKISGKDIGALLRPLTNDFMAMRYEITQALVPGIRQFTDIVHDRLIPTLKSGLVGMASGMGKAAVNFAQAASSGRNVEMISRIFAGLNPQVATFGTIAGRGFGAFLNLAYAALPLLQAMIGSADRLSARFEAWTQRVTDSGKATSWMMKAWDQATRSAHTFINFLVGIYNIFTIAGKVAKDNFGGGLASASQRFRDWTTSAAGVARITKYFEDAVPVLKETLGLFGDILKGIGHLGASPGMANLIHQLRTEFLPMLSNLFHSIGGQTGFGPALIDFLSAIASILSNIPLGGLTDMLRILAGLAATVAWLVAHVPGLGPAIGLFLTLWTVTGAALKIASKGLKAFEWITKLTGPTKDLTIAQKSLKLVFEGVSGAIKGVAEAVAWSLRAIGIAIAANPVGAIIVGLLLLVGILIWAYFKFQWFHDFVNWVFKGLADGAVWLAKAIAQPFIDIFNFVKWVYNGLANLWNSIPEIKVPDWVPVIGGKGFTLPKLPLMERGGVIEYETAIVGERGPEAVISGGKLWGMVGMGGPELRNDLPRGGYVVPSLASMLRTPQLAKTLPQPVAAAVAASVPGYSELLDRPSAFDTALPPVVNIDTKGERIVEAVHELTDTLLRRDAGDGKIDKLIAAMDRRSRDDNRRALARRYSY
jgi:hypothetical protein